MQDVNGDAAGPAEDEPWAPAPVDRFAFAVLDTGRIVADGETATNTAESMLYIARIADAIGYRLGAGTLEAIEVFGRASAYAALDTAANGALTLRGRVAPSGSSPEELKASVQTSGRP